MAVTVYYCKLAAAPDCAAAIRHALQQLPATMHNQVMRYKNIRDQAAAAVGKMLLCRVLEDDGLHHILSLKDLQYNLFNRPFFAYPFDFNISHSGDYVVLACTRQGKIGIDIEEKIPVEITAYRDVFNENEWNTLIQQAYAPAVFYTFWTRKEALVKAIGEGLHFPLATIDVSSETCMVQSEKCWLHPLDIHSGYITHVALNFPTDTPILLKQLYFNDIMLKGHQV